MIVYNVATINKSITWKGDESVCLTGHLSLSLVHVRHYDQLSHCTACDLQIQINGVGAQLTFLLDTELIVLDLLITYHEIHNFHPSPVHGPSSVIEKCNLPYT